MKNEKIRCQKTLHFFNLVLKFVGSSLQTLCIPSPVLPIGFYPSVQLVYVATSSKTSNETQVNQAPFSQDCLQKQYGQKNFPFIPSHLHHRLIAWSETNSEKRSERQTTSFRLKFKPALNYVEVLQTHARADTCTCTKKLGKIELSYDPVHSRFYECCLQKTRNAGGDRTFNSA